MDEVIYEEFKGTGNSEIHLDRKMAEKRNWPAMNTSMSSTRRDDLIVDPETLQKLEILRRITAQLPPEEATKFITDRLKKTKTNKDFFETMKRAE